MAFFTFGEGYHNYHHEFQHDYRNGVKSWQWDPTKWTIWLLSKIGMTEGLRRVPSEKILLAEIAQTQKQLEAKLQASSVALPAATQSLLEASEAYLQEAMQELREELKMALAHLKFVKTIEAGL